MYSPLQWWPWPPHWCTHLHNDDLDPHTGCTHLHNDDPTPTPVYSPRQWWPRPPHRWCRPRCLWASPSVRRSSPANTPANIQHPSSIQRTQTKRPFDLGYRVRVPGSLPMLWTGKEPGSPTRSPKSNSLKAVLFTQTWHKQIVKPAFAGDVTQQNLRHAELLNFSLLWPDHDRTMILAKLVDWRLGGCVGGGGQFFARLLSLLKLTRGSRAVPLVPKIYSKSWLHDLEGENPYLWANFGLRAPPWNRNSAGLPQPKSWIAPEATWSAILAKPTAWTLFL